MIGKIETNNVNFWYGDFHALKGISMSIEERSVVALSDLRDVANLLSSGCSIV